MSVGNRGKVAEGKVRALFNQIKASESRFMFERLPDARAAGGILKRSLADFLVAHGEHKVLVEVKEIEHAYRLPAKNFKVEQIGRLGLWQHCGMRVSILVYHSVDKVWRSPSLAYFQERSAAPSWDLREFQAYPTAAAAWEGFMNGG